MCCKKQVSHIDTRFEAVITVEPTSKKTTLLTIKRRYYSLKGEFLFEVEEKPLIVGVGTNVYLSLKDYILQLPVSC